VSLIPPSLFPISRTTLSITRSLVSVLCLPPLPSLSWNLPNLYICRKNLPHSSITVSHLLRIAPPLLVSPIPSFTRDLVQSVDRPLSTKPCRTQSRHTHLIFCEQQYHQPRLTSPHPRCLLLFLTPRTATWPWPGFALTLNPR